MRTMLVTSKAAAMLGLTAAIALIANGCALTNETITLDYAPAQGAAVVAGAGATPVKAAVTDNRQVKDRVSSKKNGYGMEMAPISADRDVNAIVADAIEQELAARGFPIASGTVEVAVSLEKFLNDFKMGMWSGDAMAEVIMGIQVKKADGTGVFARTVQGQGHQDKIQVATGKNAKPALEAALKDAVGQLMADQKFLDALVQAGGV